MNYCINRYIAGLRRAHLALDATPDGPLVPPDAVPDGFGTEDDFMEYLTERRGRVYVLFPAHDAVDVEPRLWMCPPTQPSDAQDTNHTPMTEDRIAELEADVVDTVAEIVGVWARLRRIRSAVMSRVGSFRGVSADTILPNTDSCSTADSSTSSKAPSTNTIVADVFASTIERKLVELSDPARRSRVNVEPLTFIVLDGTYRQAK